MVKIAVIDENVASHEIAKKKEKKMKKVKKTYVTAIMVGEKKTNPRNWWQNMKEIVKLKKGQNSLQRMVIMH